MYQVYIKFLLLVSVLWTHTVIGAPDQTLPVLGSDFIIVDNKIAQNEHVQKILRQSPNKVHVLEFFSYGCFACSQVHGPLITWSEKHPNLAIHNYHIAYNKILSQLRKMYYTLVAIEGSSRHLDDKVFDSLLNGNQKLWLDEQMQDFIKKNDIDLNEFNEKFNSFSINMQTSNAGQLSRAFAVDATPKIFVIHHDEVYSTDLTMTRSVPRLLQVLDFLVQNPQLPS